MKIVLHIDMDAFYASVEERDRPEIKGMPVVVGAVPPGRGVVSTCNYPARKFGVRSGMPINIAYRKCPDCVFLPVNMDKYIEESIKCAEIFRSYADSFEPGGIDEFYLDISKRCKRFSQAVVVAKMIKEELKEKRGLTCSIGIGPNKLISKIAAGRQKPDGLTVVTPNEVQDFLDPMDVNSLLGVGPKTKAFLNAHGIITVKDLRKVPKARLVELLGKFGSVLYDEARGIDESPLVESWEPKSIGRHVTFEKDTKDKELIFQTMAEIVSDTVKQLKSQGKKYRTVTIMVRYQDFWTTSKAKTVKEPHKDEETAQNLAKELLVPFLKDQRKIRLIGVSVSKLED